jgi:hypothetical protein
MESRVIDNQPRPCQLCGRVTRCGTTEHHLIPRTCHTNKWFKKQYTRDEMHETISVCRDCHRAIHDLIPDEKELGRHYSSLELLAGNEKIARYVSWVRKQK